MSSTLPIPAPDPRFDAARKHAEFIRSSFRRGVAACVAFGLELLHLKEQVGALHGGARGASSNNLNLKWSDLVARETGFSYQRCQDFMKAGAAVSERLRASRKKGDADVKVLVQTPPSTWTGEDYDVFADHLAGAFNAETFKALMLDLFPPQDLKPSNPERLTQGDFYNEMLAAHDCVAQPIISLHRTQLNPEQFIRHLDQLPVDDLEADPETGRPAITGLKTLSHVLALTLQQIDDTLKAKTKRK